MDFTPPGELNIGMGHEELSPLVDPPEWAGHVTEVVVEDPDDRPPKVLYEYRGRVDPFDTVLYIAVIRGGAERVGVSDVEFHLNGTDSPHVRAITTEENLQTVVGSCLSTMTTFHPVYESSEPTRGLAADGGFEFGNVRVPDPDGEEDEVNE